MGFKDKNKQNRRDNEDSIAKYLSLNLKLLACMGLSVDLRENQALKKLKLLKKIPAITVVTLEIFGLYSQVCLITDALGERQFIVAARISSDMFSTILCASKGIRLVFCATQVNLLLRELAVLWRKYVPRHPIRNEVLQKANAARFICQIGTAMGTFGIIVYCLPAVLNLASVCWHLNAYNHTYNYDKRVFFMKYPFDVKDSLTYSLVILEEVYACIGTAIIWICGDVLFAQLTIHASLQFRMLCHDIESMINAEYSSATLQRKFVIIIHRHNRLLKVCNDIEQIYSPIVLVMVLVSAINICVNIFDLTETVNAGKYTSVGIPCFLLINTFFALGFYCILAEALTAQISVIGNVVYNSHWADKRHNFWIFIQMLIMKSQRPFQCTAYGFFPIGHQRLSMVLNTAFSYYMMLQATT